EAVTELKRQQKPSPASLATAAADQVRSIVEAAEKSAADIQSQAEGEARRITSDASLQARETREKADSDAGERVRKAEEAADGRRLHRRGGGRPGGAGARGDLGGRECRDRGRG